MSKTGALFGNAFRVKPVIAHKADGAGKVAVVHSREGGARFALERVAEYFTGKKGRPRILFQHTDNQEWMDRELIPRFESAVPDIEILIHPLSLTSGVHMGPGTWALAMIEVNN